MYRKLDDVYHDVIMTRKLEAEKTYLKANFEEIVLRKCILIFLVDRIFSSCEWNLQLGIDPVRCWLCDLHVQRISLDPPISGKSRINDDLQDEFLKTCHL